MDVIRDLLIIITENHLAAFLSVIVAVQAGTLVLLLIRTRRGRAGSIDGSEQLPGDAVEHWRHLDEKISTWEARLDEVGGEMDRLREGLYSTISRTSVIRYNALPGTGGEQSFSAAFLDEKGDGVVISALHGRMECWVYGKAISRGRGLQRLSPEETRAVAEAMGAGKGNFHRRKGE